MSHLCSTVVRCWGTRPTLRLSGYLWVAAMFGVLAILEVNRIGVFLVPPFGATPTILMLLPDAPYGKYLDCADHKKPLCPPVHRTRRAYVNSRLSWSTAAAHVLCLGLADLRPLVLDKEWRAKCNIDVRGINWTNLLIRTCEFQKILDHKTTKMSQGASRQIAVVNE